MSVLFEFLQKNQIERSESLPLVHTTRAHHLRSILKTGKIVTSPCDVFVGENLNYFFVGRPAYKFPLDNTAEFWELPVCFVLDYRCALNRQRVFPFDSGGFANRRLPQYLTSHDIASFEVSSDPDADKKIIGTFFGTAHNYYKFNPRRDLDVLRKHDVSMLDSEIFSLHKLSISRDKDFDDRYFSIEVQSTEDVDLSGNNLLAAIVPSPYLDDPDFLDLATEVWQCELLAYDIYPLRPETYYFGIYSLVESLLRDKGFFK
jgi:hypothetical protein